MQRWLLVLNVSKERHGMSRDIALESSFDMCAVFFALYHRVQINESCCRHRGSKMSAWAPHDGVLALQHCEMHLGVVGAAK